MKTLYKKDSKGKTRIWKIWTEGAKIIQEAGILDGKLVRNEKIATIKNKGKSNETTPEEQAISEMNSTYDGKLTEGYFKTKEEAETEEVILPMLAKSYEDEKHKINWNSLVYIQPKLDGMRCLCIIKDGEITLKSRDGKIIQNMNHIIDNLKNFGFEDVIFDGELYAHGLSFQDNMKLIKKYRPGETEKINYHVYDCVSEEPFSERRKLLKSFNLYDIGYIEEVDTQLITSEKQLKKWHIQFVGEGYEGSIVRHSHKPYGIDKRCDSLLKYKEFQDIDAEIIDVEPADQRPEWGIPVLKYNDKIFRAGMKYSHEEREEFLKNKKDYIGKIANIRFFEWTDDGNPRFPVMCGIYLDR